MTWKGLVTAKRRGEIVNTKINILPNRSKQGDWEAVQWVLSFISGGEEWQCESLLWQLHLPPPFYFWMEEYLERVIIGGAGLQVWFVYYVFVVNRTGSISQLITILHSCGQEIPRAVLFHVFRFFLTWPVIQIGAGGSVERKKGRQRGIEGVASVVNEKITGSLPSGSCTKAVMT